MSICLGKIMQADMNSNDMSPSLELDIDIINHWGQCYMKFNEVNSFKILNEIGDLDTMVNDSYKKLEGIEILMLEHPKGGTWAPIAIKKEEDSEWIYKEDLYGLE